MSPTSGFTTSRVCGQCAHAARLYHQREKMTRPRRLHGLWSMPSVSFLDSQLEHGETSSTAEATRGHFACVDAVLGGPGVADPGDWHRGLTETPSRPADLFTAPAVPGRGAAWMFVWRFFLMWQQRAGVQRRRLLIKKYVTAKVISKILKYKASSIAPLVWTADGRPHLAVTRTLHCSRHCSVP